MIDQTARTPTHKPTKTAEMMVRASALAFYG